MLPSALIAATLIVRNVFDTFAPVRYTPGVIHIRSRIMSQTLVLIFVLAAARGVWRTGRIRSGLAVAFVSAVLGGMLSSVGAALMLAMWHDPATLRAWEMSGGIGEALWAVPLLLVPISIVTGTAGALLGRVVALSFSAGR